MHICVTRPQWVDSELMLAPQSWFSGEISSHLKLFLWRKNNFTFQWRSFTNERTLKYWNLLVLCDKVIDSSHFFKVMDVVLKQTKGLLHGIWLACYSGYWQVYLRECLHEYEKFDIACFTNIQWAASMLWCMAGVWCYTRICYHTCMLNPCHAAHVVYGTIKDFEFELEFGVFLQDDPEIPFTEDDYRRRKPHPNFKEHIAAEKAVIKMGKTVSGARHWPW